MKSSYKKLLGRDFILVVIGQVISLFGNAILRFAFPLYLLKETDSGAIFGMVMAISFIPMIVLSIIGGILADRVNKRNIMIALDFITSILIIGAYFALGKVSAISLSVLMLIFLFGISGIYQPVVQASIPFLVSEERLVFANAVINMVNTLANLIGPVVGGVLFAVGGLDPILVVSAICFMVSSIMEAFIKIPFHGRIENKGVCSIAKDDLKESFDFIKRERPIFFSIGVIVSMFNLVLTAAMVVGVPIIVIQVLKMNDTKLGIAQGAMAFGGLLGGIFAVILQKKLHLRNAYRLLGICALCVGIMGFVLFLNLSNFTAYVVIVMMCFCAMIAATVFTIRIFAMIQSQTPPDFVGKIMATLIAGALSAQPIGQAVYGILFDRFRDTVWIILFGTVFISILISVYSKRIFENIPSLFE